MIINVIKMKTRIILMEFIFPHKMNERIMYMLEQCIHYYNNDKKSTSEHV